MKENFFSFNASLTEINKNHEQSQSSYQVLSDGGEPWLKKQNIKILIKLSIG